MNTPLYQLSATELLTHYKAETLSPVEVVESVLARMDACEPHIHAVWWRDRDAALQAARASEKRWQSQSPQGDLDGVPVTLKENIATQGLPSPLGSAATELVPAKADAPAAARLDSAVSI